MKLPDKKLIPEPGFYYHYKHNDQGSMNNFAYEVLSIGFHTEVARPGEEFFVNYRPLYPEAVVYQASQLLGFPCIDNRPLGMWMDEEVEYKGKIVRRFEKITDPEVVKQLKEIRKQMYGV